MENIQFQFPFFGAGNAAYDMTACIQLLFKVEPEQEIREKIAASAPKPISNLYWAGNFAEAFNSEPIHLKIMEVYPLNDALEHECCDADPRQIALFNADIERWLAEVNQLCPMIFAQRISEETEFSVWHYWSLNKIATIYPDLETMIQNTNHDFDLINTACDIIQLAIDAGLADGIPQKLMERFDFYTNPGKKAISLLEKEQSNDLIEYIQEIKELNPEGLVHTLKKLGKEFLNNNGKYDSTLDRISDFLLMLDELPLEIIQTFILGSWIDKEEKKIIIKERVRQVPDEAEHIGYTASKQSLAGKYPVAIKLFDLILDLNLKDLSAYCNALYVAQNDNNGLGVNRELNRRFLAYSLPHGPENPDIFLNASFLYVEMKEYENAIDCIENAVINGSQNVFKYKDNPFFKDLFSMERFQKSFSIKSYKKNPKEQTDLLQACEEGNLDAVKRLIEAGVTPNSIKKTILDFDGKMEKVANSRETPLTIAALNKHLSVVYFLVENSADINERDRLGRNLLCIMATNNNLEAIQFSLSHGADINIHDISGNTPLIIASARGYEQLVKLLIEKGADIECINLTGENALMQSAICGQKNIVNYLLQKGADPSIRANNGFTALQYAKKFGHGGIAQLLLSYTQD